jgi:hypothetical protein
MSNNLSLKMKEHLAGKRHADDEDLAARCLGLVE